MEIVILWDMYDHFRSANKILGLSIPVRINGNDQNVYINVSFMQRLEGYDRHMSVEGKRSLLGEHEPRLCSAIEHAISSGRDRVGDILHVTDEDL